MNHGCKNSGHTACYNGGQTAREKSRKHNHECVALRLLIMGRIHPCMRIFLQGGIGKCLVKCLLCIYLVSVYQVGCVFAMHPWQMVSPWKYIWWTSSLCGSGTWLCLKFLPQNLRQSLSCSWYKVAATQHSVVFSFPNSCQGMFT
jgi:hypothetical protein